MQRIRGVVEGMREMATRSARLRGAAVSCAPSYLRRSHSDPAHRRGGQPCSSTNA